MIRALTNEWFKWYWSRQNRWFIFIFCFVVISSLAETVINDGPGALRFDQMSAPNWPLMELIGLLSMYWGAQTIAIEYQQGTLALYITRPIHRLQLLSAKFLIVVFASVLTMLLMWCICSIVRAVVMSVHFGFDAMVQSMHMNLFWNHFEEHYVAHLDTIILVSCFSVFISVWMNNHWVAVGLTMLLGLLMRLTGFTAWLESSLMTTWGVLAMLLLGSGIIFQWRDIR